MSTIAELKRELAQSKDEKESMYKNIRTLNSGTESLENIISKGKPAGNHHGLVSPIQRSSPHHNLNIKESRW